MQHAKITARYKCKTKILQRVKVQHEIEQYRKTVPQEKTCNMKRLLYKIVPQRSIKKVQHEKKDNMKKMKNSPSETRKKCTGIARYSAKMDNGKSVVRANWVRYFSRIIADFFRYWIRRMECATFQICKNTKYKWVARTKRLFLNIHYD